MNILTVESLRKGFKPHFFSKQKQVLKNLSFTIQSGRTTGFIGVNGAGKTSTLKCVLGFTRPDYGTIRFFDGHALDNAVKSKIGYLPERPYYYDFLTAKEFLKFHWDLSGAPSDGFESAADEVLTKVNLKSTGTKKLRSFSKGMLQRIGMAQALLHKPQFLILDEPMSGLDPDGRLLIKEIMQDEKRKGTSIFFSSHLLHDMDELCDDLVVIDKGVLIYQGTLSDFVNKDEGVEKSFKALRLRLGGLGQEFAE